MGAVLVVVQDGDGGSSCLILDHEMGRDGCIQLSYRLDAETPFRAYRPSKWRRTSGAAISEAEWVLRPVAHAGCCCDWLV